MNEFTFFENTNALSEQLAKKRGTPLNYFLSPYIERYFKKLEAQMGMHQVGANANPLAPNPMANNPLAGAIKGGMTGGNNMDTTGY